MTHVHDTWYLLEDGSKADPNEIAHDENGVLRHKNGLAVALRENGVPRTTGNLVVDRKNQEDKKSKVDQPKKGEARQSKPSESSDNGYKTRESKAE